MVKIELISFSFKSQNLPEANYIFDVRFLSNPFYVDELRDLTGLDKEVINFFKNDSITQNFLNKFLEWSQYLIKHNIGAKKEKIVIAIGCTGGQHRSPYITERLGEYLLGDPGTSELTIYHRELKKYNVALAKR